MRVLNLNQETKQELLKNLLNRNPGSYTSYESTVNEIIDNVRNNKDKALFDYTLKFDKCEINSENISCDFTFIFVLYCFG